MEVSMVDYIVEGKIVVIVGSSDDEEEIIIPEFIDELPVAKIGANSFNELKNLKRVHQLELLFYETKLIFA